VNAVFRASLDIVLYAVHRLHNSIGGEIENRAGAVEIQLKDVAAPVRKILLYLQGVEVRLKYAGIKPVYRLCIEPLLY